MVDGATGIDPIRHARNRQAMIDFDLDVLICRLPENVLLLTGYWPLSSAAFVVAPRDGVSYLIAPDTEVAFMPADTALDVRVYTSALIDSPHPLRALGLHLRDILRSAGLERARIGYEASFEAVAPGHCAGEVLVPTTATRESIASDAPKAALLDAGPALNHARARKTPRELVALRHANTIAAFGIEAFRAAFLPGRRESHVAAEVESAIMSKGIGHDGALHVRSWAQLMSGPGSAAAYSLHPATSHRVIERGDLGVLELGVVVDGYWSDLTRTLVAGGSPSVRQAEMYGALQAAHESVMRAARPGMTGGEVDGLARAEIEQRGFGKLFLHQTGHGLGFRYHEPQPLLHPANRDLLEEGMVSSIEPGLYLEGFGGMRLEENVVFTANGVELLSHAPVTLAGESE